MIVKESDIRAKIRRLLAEDFKFYDGQKPRISDVDSIKEGDCVVFDLTSKPITSNILHRLTKDSKSSYAAWKNVFENIFILNMEGAVDKNLSNSNNVFYDAVWDETYYSIKSTLSEGRSLNNFQTKAYSGNPTFTIDFIKSLANEKSLANKKRNKENIYNEKQYKAYGIIVATRIENELIWQRVGESQMGYDIFDKYQNLVTNDPNSKILNVLKSGQNPLHVIQHFFGKGYTNVLKVKLAPQTLSYEENPLLEKIYDKIDELQYAVEKYAFINKDKLNNDAVLDQIENDIKTLVDFVSRAMIS